MRGENRELKVRVVSETTGDLVRMVGEVEEHVGSLDSFLTRSMRKSVLALRVESVVLQVNMMV